MAHSALVREGRSADACGGLCLLALLDWAVERHVDMVRNTASEVGLTQGVISKSSGLDAGFPAGLWE